MAPRRALSITAVLCFMPLRGGVFLKSCVRGDSGKVNQSIVPVFYRSLLNTGLGGGSFCHFSSLTGFIPGLPWCWFFLPCLTEEQWQKLWSSELSNFIMFRLTAFLHSLCHLHLLLCNTHSRGHRGRKWPKPQTETRWAMILGQNGSSERVGCWGTLKLCVTFPAHRLSLHNFMGLAAPHHSILPFHILPLRHLHSS